MNDFIRDDEWQKTVRDMILVSGFYDVMFPKGYVFLDGVGVAREMQQKFAVDTIVQHRWRSAFIEEKIVRWPGYEYECFCLETHSCTVPGREKSGWMEYGRADFLLYCFQQENGDLDCHLIDFPRLKVWFWPLVDSFKTFGPLDTLNRSAGRKVRIGDVHASVPTRRRLIRSNSYGR